MKWNLMGGGGGYLFSSSSAHLLFDVSLSEQVLKFTNEDLREHILGASVRKKPYDNRGVRKHFSNSGQLTGCVVWTGS